MTKEEAFEEINKTQDFYVDELIKLISSPDYSSNKSLNFTSATGTGKTKMITRILFYYNDVIKGATSSSNTQ